MRRPPLHPLPPSHLLWLIVLLLGVQQPAMAQNSDDGSVYSRFGLGELTTFSSSQIQAMGGGGVALWSLNYANFNNPAAWGYQVLTRAVGSVYLENLATTDADDNTKRISGGSFNAIQFSFPLLDNKLGVGLSFEPYSRVNYRVQTLGQLLTDPTANDSTQFRVNFEGRGGLQKIRAGAGYRLSDALSLGASIDVLFGIIEEGRRTTFASVNIAETNVATSTRYVGASGTFGALLSLSDLLKSNDDLTFGASLVLPTRLSANRALTLGESLDRDTLSTEIDGTLTLPLSARFGAAYHLDNRWVFVADGRYEPWSSFDSDLALPGFSPGGTNQFQDRLRASFGAEIRPAGANLLAPYFNRVAYRLGFFYDQAYVNPAAGQTLRTVGLTGGFSFPAVLPGTHLDINLEAGTRGTATGMLVRDRYLGITATLNVGERWFQQRKLR